MASKAIKTSLLANLAFALLLTMFLLPEANAQTLSQGTKGTNVKQVTTRLYSLKYLSKSNVSSTYTSAVTSAVKYFQITAGISPTGKVDDNTRQKLFASSAPKKVGYTTLKQGCNSSKVQTTKKRLYALGYLPSSAVNKKYDATTVSAVKSFQKAMSLSQTGKADVLTLTYLFSSLAKKSSGTASTPSPTATPKPAATTKPTATPKPTTYKDLAYGLKKNTAVKNMQVRLKALGYLEYSGSASGTYESKTATAVEKFQKMAGLTVNKKKASASMQKALFSEDAPSNNTPTVPTVTSGDPLKPIIGTVLNIDWFGSAKSTYYDQSKGIFNVGKVATIVDVNTGICFRVKRKGGLSHADIEPLTAFDTWQMYRTYSNKWSWNRRAIWVVVDNVTLAASGNGMPHDSSSISDNNVDGHFCIHFLNSKTHGTDKVDSDHQKMVSAAASASVPTVQARIDAQ